MFIFKRNAYYYLEYFDDQENRIKRVSTRSKTMPKALKFLTVFKEKLEQKEHTEYITLAQFKIEYSKYAVNTKSSGYVRTINYSFEKLINFLSADIPLSKISIKNIEEFISDKFESSKYGTALSHRTLKSAFNKAINWNYISSNPFVKVKLPKLPKPDPVFITHQQLNLILINEPNNDLKDIYTLALKSGMRLNEILNLKWYSVDFEQKEIRVQNTDSFTTKSKRDRTIPMNQTLFLLMQKRVPKIHSIYRDEYVFEKTKGIKYCQFYISKKFKKAVRASELDERTHFHSLRHGFISALVEKNCSLAVVQQLAGHAQISTTLGYIHLQKENLQNAVNLLD